MIVAQIEAAMIETLRNAAVVFADQVQSYAGEIDDDVFETVRKLPAVWCTFGGANRPRAVGMSKAKWRYDATFVSICAARNITSERAARAGTPGELGVYDMLDQVHKLLQGNDFGLPVLRFEPGAMRVLVNARQRGDGIAAYSQEWHTAWIEQQPPEVGAEWLKLGLNYYLKPGDDTADAADLVTLQAAP
jgi:phage gp37-like protein